MRGTGQHAVMLAAVLALNVSFGNTAHADGADVFNDNCAVCHSTEPGINKTGPSLAGVVGRKAGSLADFPYSSAMTSAGVVWTKAELNIYLANPQGVVHGTKMTFPGVKNAKERVALIDYLATLKN
jgi:cytochrome c2